MHIRAPAIVVAIRAHGEHGAVVRALTAEHGLQAGYVRGGRSTRLRPILQPGNTVIGEWRARTDDQLGSLTLELTESRAPLYADPLAAAAIDWACALTASALPEAQPYPRLHAALEGVLDAIGAAPSARGWAAALVRYEALVLRELGYAEAMPGLPGGDAAWPDLLRALDAIGAGLHRHLFADRRGHAFDARERLLTRLKRAVA
ncbi:DNA repair protein RecO [Sphingomonas gilva]|uniref:DNA repair protein RecO n=1 Tax=Sphingomonas gilva TaxID=2305907 RepID=A0A396RN96_9SPHN|nr:recombination protein O N-terminal domain-containing protein [Sphingomonas gilva]RHW17957.1 DNA repair protein RecO [Sphingomonas gilva]